MKNRSKYWLCVILLLVGIAIESRAQSNSDSIFIEVDVRLIAGQETNSMSDCTDSDYKFPLEFKVLKDYVGNCDRNKIKIQTACPLEFIAKNKKDKYPKLKYKLRENHKTEVFIVDGFRVRGTRVYYELVDN